jgi:hypothetical protein
VGNVGILEKWRREEGNSHDFICEWSGGDLIFGTDVLKFVLWHPALC